MLRDDFDLMNKSCVLNVILRGGRDDGTPRLLIFGFAINLPTEALMEQSGGHDIHLIARVTFEDGGSKPYPVGSHKSPEDILEGIQAFKSD